MNPLLPRTESKLRALFPCLALAFLAFLFAVCVYRAANQSVTVDEAFIYSNFIHTEKLALFTRYDAGHHILYTYLCWLSTKLFGTSELTLRLPSLLGALGFFAVVYQLCRRVFGYGPAFLFAVVVLASNPLILNHLSIARGYGMALALFAWSFHLSLRYLDAPANPNPLFAAGICLGLSVAANLTFAIPGCALIAMTLVLNFGHARQTGGIRKLVDTAVGQYIGPGLVTCSLLIMLPLNRALPRPFYFGASSLRDSVSSLVQYCFLYKDSFSFLPAFSRAVSRLVNSTVFSAIPVMLLGMAVVLVIQRRSSDKLLPLSIGSLFLPLAVLVTAHAAIGNPLPYGRTGLYLLFLFPLAALGAWKSLWSHGGAARWLAIPWLVPLGVAALLFLLQFDARYYVEWKLDSQTRTAMQIIRAAHAGNAKAVRFGGSWDYQSSMNFYRQLYRMDWMQPFEPDPSRPGLNYYLLAGGDAHVVEDLKLHKLFQSDLCDGCILAAP